MEITRAGFYWLTGFTAFVLTVLICGWKNDANAAAFAKFSVQQVVPTINDTIPLAADDTIPPTVTDTIPNNDTLNVATGGLDAPVKYNADDSIVYDIENKKVYLYGNAYVEYKDITLKAALIIFDWTDNTVKAKVLRTDSGDVGRPVFTQGDESYGADSLAYNFETRRGRISELLTKQDEGYLHSEVIKKSGDESYFGLNNKYTTCNYRHPDYYIRTKKVKVIPKKIIVTGPANLVVGDVPTPLFLPFGLFPIKQERSSGLIFPQYGERSDLGFYLADGGYYFALSDYMDLALTGTIYSRGSWGVNVGTHYAKRYRYNGSLTTRYVQERTIDSESGEVSKYNQFLVNGSYNRDPKSNPNYRFRANVNFGTSGYNRRYNYNPENRLNNTMQSSISYDRIFRNKPLSFSISANHQQNTLSHQVSISLPEIAFGVTQIYPFKRKEVIGKTRWYEKISTSYTLNAKNYTSGIDTILFRGNTTEDVLKSLSDRSSYGARHNVPLSTNVKVFKYFTVTPSVNYTQWFYGRTVRHFWNNDSLKVESDTVSGFATAYQYNASIAADTRLYGMYGFKRGKIKAIRHVFNPRVAFTYQPDFGGDKFNFYNDIQSDTIGNTYRYSRFQTGIYGGPGEGLQGLVSLNLGNNLEMKVASRKDTVSGVKKITLLDRLDFNTAYNLAADSLKWQPMTLRGNTTILNKINVNFGATWDPYAVNPANLRRVDTLELEKNNRLARLTSAQVAVGGNFSFGKKQPTRTSSKGSPDEWEMLRKYPEYFVDFSVPVNLSFNYNLRVDRNIIQSGDTTIFNQTINLRLDMNLTSNWKINVTTNYDIKNKEFTTTFIEVFRDLHCWQMRFGWVPFGQFQSYNFDLRVKSSLLQDLKISRRKGWNDFSY